MAFVDIAEDDFECFARTGVNTPETMFPIRGSANIGFPVKLCGSAFVGTNPEALFPDRPRFVSESSVFGEAPELPEATTRETRLRSLFIDEISPAGLPSGSDRVRGPLR